MCQLQVEGDRRYIRDGKEATVGEEKAEGGQEAGRRGFGLGYRERPGRLAPSSCPRTFADFSLSRDVFLRSMCIYTYIYMHEDVNKPSSRWLCVYAACIV